MSPVENIRQTVILAAGRGRRIGCGQLDVPKALLAVAGRSLLLHALHQAETYGCEEAVIVAGYRADKVERYLEGLSISMRLTTVYNSEFDGPNGVSLLAAEPRVDERFFLQMADHLFAAPVFERLAAREAGPSRGARLLIDREPLIDDLDDATKVRLDGARIVEIGKRISRWDAVDAGCFLLDRRIFDALRQAAKQGPPTVSAGMRHLAAQRLLVGVDIEGVSWLDVDTPEALQAAQELLVGTLPS